MKQVTSQESNSPEKKRKQIRGNKISPRNTLVNKINTGKHMLCHSLQCYHCFFSVKPEKFLARFFGAAGWTDSWKKLPEIFYRNKIWKSVGISWKQKIWPDFPKIFCNFLLIGSSTGQKAKTRRPKPEGQKYKNREAENY